MNRIKVGLIKNITLNKNIDDFPYILNIDKNSEYNYLYSNCVDIKCLISCKKGLRAFFVISQGEIIEVITPNYKAKSKALTEAYKTTIIYHKKK